MMYEGVLLLGGLFVTDSAALLDPAAAEFDAYLKQHDPSWGLPCVPDLVALGHCNNLEVAYVAPDPCGAIAFRKCC